jgi:hypothetical protein
MIIFLISLIKEFISTCNTKLYCNNKDFLAAFGCFLASFIGQIKDAFVLGIPITPILIIKALTSSFAVLLASLIVIPVFKRFNFKKDKPYEYIIRFKNIQTCEFINLQLKEKGIKTYFKEHSQKLIVDSKNRSESKIVEKIIDDNYKTLKVHELKDYRKIN